MSTSKFADVHNLVVFLSKPTESEGFKQIVDFLNANPIKYALTEYEEGRKGFLGNDTPLFPPMMMQAQEDMRADEALNAKNVSQHSNDPLLSGEDSIQPKELMEICTNLQNMVIDLETTKITQALEIDSLKRRVKKLEKKKRSRTHKLKRLYKVSLSAGVKSSTKESLGENDASKQGRKIADIDADKELTLVDETTEEHGRLNDQDEIMFEVNADLHDAEVVVDKEAQNVQNVVEEVIEDITTAGIKEIVSKRTRTIDDEKAKLFLEFLKKRRKLFAAKRAEERRNIPPTKAQQRSLMCTYLKNMDGWKLKALKRKSFTEIQELFDKEMTRINNFVDFRTELVEESSMKAEENSSKRAGDEREQESAKKHKVDDDQEAAELKKCLEIIPDDEDDMTIGATPLSSMSPTIIDYKIYKEGRKGYFQIIRADGNSQIYYTFSKMLKNFNREDLEVLRSIVKARFEKVQPVDDMDCYLLHNLKTMFEHHVEDYGRINKD
nr:hypothetical protein [Tanacetum cinerariifolium]